MLVEILVRLPPKCVLRFRCVSKSWNKTIQDPVFLHSYADRRKKLWSSPSGRLLAFFPVTDVNWEPPTKVLSVSDQEIGFIPKKYGFFICSSNGVILCGHHPMFYYVFNPLTKKCVSLPFPDILNERENTSIGLVCEENANHLAISYKVVWACWPVEAYVMDDKLKIQTYSSKTGTWIKSVLKATDEIPLGLLYDNTIVTNGVIHWWGPPRMKYIALYDPNIRKFHLQFIEQPPIEIMTFDLSYSRSSDDVLWCGEISTDNDVKLWMLPKLEKGYMRFRTIRGEEWTLMHKVASNSLGINTFGLIFIALNPWNPLVVIFRKGEWICQYNVESRSVEVVQCYHKPSANLNLGYRWRPYFESPFLSSYTL